MVDKDPTAPPIEGSNIKPLPPSPTNDNRPGTSGTELNLRTNREKASTAFERAQRAEKAYRAKRRATYARRDYQAAKEHFKTAGKSLREGSKCAWSAITAGPAIMKEKSEKARLNRERKDRERAEEKRRLWEEKVRKKGVDEGMDEEDDDPTAEPVTVAG